MPATGLVLQPQNQFQVEHYLISASLKQAGQKREISMQSTRYIEIAKQIHEQALVAQLIKCLEEVIFSHARPNFELSKTKAEFHDLIFKARDNLVFFSRDPEAKQLIELLGISDAFDPNLVGRLIYCFQSKGTRDELRSASSEFINVLFFYHTLKAFARTVAALETLIEKPRHNALKQGESSLGFEVLELGEKGFEIERVEEILPLIRDLYAQVGTVYGVTNSTPRILFMDSGSGLVVTIKGDSKIVDAIRKLFMSVWDKVRFRKLDDIERKLETIDSSLEVLAKIRESQTSGTISPEDASRLRHLIAADVISLFQKGASLREIHRAEVLENQKLLKGMVEVKFLTDGDEDTATDTPPPQ